MRLFSRGCHKNLQLNGDWYKLFCMSLEASFSFLPQNWGTTKMLTGQWELDGKCCPSHLLFSLLTGHFIMLGDFKGLHQISRGETQISRDINKRWMRSIKSQIKQMELSTTIQTGKSSRVARVGDEKNSKGLMQNRSMGVGSAGAAWGEKYLTPIVFRQDQNSSESILPGGVGREKPWPS